MNLFLYAPEYRPNLSSMVRSAEFFGFKKIFVFDEHALLNPPTNKKGRADMAHLARVWTAGAVDFIQIETVADPIAFFDQYAGRIVGTVVNPLADHLHRFRFEPDDLLLFGSEKNGLPPEVLQRLHAALYIPSIGTTDCLNVAVTFGIVVHQALRGGG